MMLDELIDVRCLHRFRYAGRHITTACDGLQKQDNGKHACSFLQNGNIVSTRRPHPRASGAAIPYMNMRLRIPGL
jgi:hypothetical protein